MVVHKLTHSEFITTVSRSLFLVHKIDQLKTTQITPIDVNEQETNRSAIPNDQDDFKMLKLGIEKDKVEPKDIDNIM